MGKRYESKLPGINQGSKYAMQDEEKDGKAPLEKLVFNITWVRRCPLTTPVSGQPLLAGRASSSPAPRRPHASVRRRDSSLSRRQAGIFILIAIEIFINTPAFQAVKPAILSFTQGGV